MPGVHLLQTDSFAELRRKNGYYVDKTAFLEEFLRAPSDATLFTRPQGFGKSMLLSMLAEFLAMRKNGSEADKEQRRALFQGLQVTANTALCNEWMHQYPMIFFSLKIADTPHYEEALAAIRARISKVCRDYEEVIESPKLDEVERSTLRKLRAQQADPWTLRTALVPLTRAMATHYGKPVVVLIDDHDAPLEMAARQGYAEEMIQFLQVFLASALQLSRKYWRFVVLTGCLRVARITAYNDGLDYLDGRGVADPFFSRAFGFTQTEVARLLADAGLSHRQAEIGIWYGGYRLGQDQEELFCPRSLMRFVAEAQVSPQKPPRVSREGDSDAAPSISPGALLGAVLRHQEHELGNGIAVLLAGGCLVCEPEGGPTYVSLDNTPGNLWTLLYDTGCLTRASEQLAKRYGVVPQPFQLRTALVLPNEELRTIVVREMVRWFRESVREDQQDALCAALWQGDAPGLEEILRSVLSQRITARIRWDDSLWKNRGLQRCAHADTQGGPQYGPAPGHALLTGFFLSQYSKTFAPLDAARDRFVLQVLDGGRALVLEIRYASWTGELAALAQEGLGHLGEQHAAARLLDDPDIKTVLHWSVALYGTRCKACAIVVKQPSVPARQA